MVKIKAIFVGDKRALFVLLNQGVCGRSSMIYFVLFFKYLVSTYAIFLRLAIYKGFHQGA